MCDWLLLIEKNKEWLFSGIGVTVILLISHIVKRLFFKEDKKNSSMNQVNNFFSHGTQIGVQNNYYNKGDSHDR